MTKRNKKAIRSVIIRIIVVAIFIGVTIAITTNAMVTNDVALGQLNGGDEAYIAQEIYYKYKTVAPFIGTVIILWAAMPLFKILYAIFKNHKNKGEKTK